MESENNFLTDRETLASFIDELIKQKNLSTETPEDLDSLKEKSMQELDEQIGIAIFGSLTDEQDAELDQLLDQDDGTAKPYQDFFDRIGLDIKKITADTMEKYAENFLGGQNA